MKKNKTIYWISTGIFSIVVLFSAIGYFTSSEMQASFVQLGLPDYFRVELGIAKILGVLALLLPMVPYKLKFFAFSGLVITLISAAIAHLAIGDPISMTLLPVFILGALIVSYIYYHKINAPILA
ncbi:MAG TPA: DoxX family protein [Aequorivita sp.]|nr:DoxX family protein [Aequorivita sp.]